LWRWVSIVTSGPKEQILATVNGEQSANREHKCE
jgi:hypothetical protein